VDYYNTGDWVESCTALVEYSDGSFELLYRPLNAADETYDPADAAPPTARRASGPDSPPVPAAPDFLFVDAPNAG
jgi:hypothetical protein